MTAHDILQAIQDTGFATDIREGISLFPWIESVHVLAIVIVVGTISIIDMRLLGLPAHRVGVRRLMKDVLPLTWGAFAVAVITGFLLFSSAALKYALIWEFQLKMALLAAAGMNMLFFHTVTFRNVHLWDELVETPFAAKVAALSSLCLWIGVVICGRVTGFVIAAMGFTSG
jgi:hypothetical protein